MNNIINFKNSLSIFSGVSRFVPTLSPLQKTIAVVAAAIFLVFGLSLAAVAFLRRRRSTVIRPTREQQQTQLPNNAQPKVENKGDGNVEKNDGKKGNKTTDAEEPIIEEMADPDARKGEEAPKPTDTSRWIIVHPDSQKSTVETRPDNHRAAVEMPVFNLTYNQFAEMNKQQARSMIHPFNNTRAGLPLNGPEGKQAVLL